jgi:ABC-type methionine transport system ATPase subunit
LEQLRATDPVTVVKRTVKYLTVCQDPQSFDAVLRTAPNEVIATICDAAYNVHQGDVQLTEPEKNLFRAHRSAIDELISPRASIKTKREVIQSQSGEFVFLPLLISAALGALGSSLFGGTS